MRNFLRGFYKFQFSWLDIFWFMTLTAMSEMIENEVGTVYAYLWAILGTIVVVFLSKFFAAKFSRSTDN